MPINLIVKLHDRSRDLRPQYSGGIDWMARLAPAPRRPDALLATSANITPCLAAADVMITDHSSAGFEYLLLDRPLVRIDVPELIHDRRTCIPSYVRLLADAAHNVSGNDGAAMAASRGGGRPGRTRTRLSAARRPVATDLFYLPGTAAARCAAALYDVLGLSAPAVRSDPPPCESERCRQSA